MSEQLPSRFSWGRFDRLLDSVVERVRTRLEKVLRKTRPSVVSGAAIVLVLLVSAVILSANLRDQWFVYDEFDYLAAPSGQNWLSWLVTPHNEHTILFTKLWFSALYSIVGLHGYLLYAAPMVVSHLAGGVAIYRLMRLIVPSRAVAVATIAPVMIMTAGVGTLTWAGQFQYTAATTAGLWALYCALSPELNPKGRSIWMIALALFGTFSGSAFLPLGVAAGLAAISTRRYLVGIITILIPSTWFVLSRVLYTIPSYNSAHSIAQILRDGPEFIFALLNKAVADSIPVSDSFTTPLIVLSTVGVIFYLGGRGGPVGSSRARRTFLFLLISLVLSLAITLVGRLSRNLAESASGGYTYFILIVAIPLFVAMMVRLFSARRLAIAMVVLLLAGSATINIVGFQDDAQGLAAFKAPNPVLLSGAAYLASEDFPVIGDDPPSPSLAPTVPWSELRNMAKNGRISAVEPEQPVEDQLSLNLQWESSDATGSLGDCSPVVNVGAIAVHPGSTLRVESADGSASSFTLTYPTSDAKREFPLPQGGLTLATVAERTVTVPLGGVAVALCT
ncbi:hypothetical protein ITJ38_02795 [Agreia pratensis]|uniref:hypothetical protein n=1 Tax=Agreia pratensis TaxID=150121 RepID=UPI00188DBB1D|nr:hypothetical protein [Agreia pratensis]MBF4633326.1 hypothetical protein [Agreia pratensis]